MIEQPNPKPAHGDLWADLLRATPMPRELRILCRERRALGVHRYGTPLQLDNGRDMRRDAREEALDLAHAIVLGDNVPEAGTVTIGNPLPRNPERTAALRKLLEAKDAAVRAVLAK